MPQFINYLTDANTNTIQLDDGFDLVSLTNQGNDPAGDVVVGGTGTAAITDLNVALNYHGDTGSGPGELGFLYVYGGVSNQIDLGLRSGSIVKLDDWSGGTSALSYGGNNQIVELTGAGTGDMVNSDHNAVAMSNINLWIGAGEVNALGQLDNTSHSNLLSNASGVTEIINFGGTNDMLANVGGSNITEAMQGIAGANNTLFASGGSGTLTDSTASTGTKIATDGLGAKYTINAGSGLTGDVIYAGQATDTINLQNIAGQHITVYGDANQTSTLTSADISGNVASITYNAHNGDNTITMQDGQVIDAYNFSQIVFTGDGSTVPVALQHFAAGSSQAVAASHEGTVVGIANAVASIEAAHHFA
jgi:hypothetical protein